MTVYERERGGPLHARTFDPSLRGGRGDYRRRSLGHRDRERAKQYAREQVAKLERGDADIRAGRITLSRLFTLYERHRLLRKGQTEQAVNRRQIECWSRLLGGGKDASKILRRDWEAFIDARSSGAIDARGNPVPEQKRRSVRARAVGKDCQFLRHVLRWATLWQTPDGRYLLAENPARGFEIPTESNPQRPVASHDRFEKIRAVADQVEMQVGWHGPPRKAPSYLPELLDLAAYTGRRLSAICSLRYEDLRLEQTATAPHGAIRWPADTDKVGREWEAPLHPKARLAIDRALRERPGIGAAPLFPAPGHPGQPVSRHLADKWLREAERAAKLEPQKGSLWHAYRRKWATERKNLPDADVAATGGWKSTEALRLCYQHADEQTMLQVVLGGGELREVDEQ